MPFAAHLTADTSRPVSPRALRSTARYESRFADGLRGDDGNRSTLDALETRLTHQFAPTVLRHGERGASPAIYRNKCPRRIGKVGLGHAVIG